MDRDWALLAMVGAIEIKIALELAQEGQAIPVRPALGSQRLPLVVIGRQATDGDLAVDGRASAHDPSLLVTPRPHRCGDLGKGVVADRVHVCLNVGPVVVILEIMRQERQRVDLVGDVLGRRVDTRFEKGHGNTGVGRKAIGQHAASGAAANNHIVVNHGASIAADSPHCT